MTHVGHMPVAAAARMLGKLSKRVRIDETAAERGHNYITLFVIDQATDLRVACLTCPACKMLQ